MLEVVDLAVCYRNNWVVKDVSFCLQPGEITNLIGPNGAGKSTMVKAILGLIPSVRGSVYYNYQPLTKQLKKVAYVPQRNQIDWDYPVTVAKVVMMGRIRHTGWLRNLSRQSQQVIRYALEKVDMWEYRNCAIGELSGGQQQRVFLARAIAQEADLLFLDEPFTAVDAKTQSIIFEIFAELKAQGKTLLVIGHDLKENLENYDRFILLNKSIVAVGKKETVLTLENLTLAYGHQLNLALVS